MFMRNMTKASLLTVCMLSLAANASAAYKFVGGAVKENALYKQGEDVQFKVQLVDDEGHPAIGEKVSYKITKDGHNTLVQGTMKVGRWPRMIAAKLFEPGFVRVELKYQKKGEKVVKKLMGAGVDPLDIKAGMDVPEDFDAFWQGKIDEVHAMKMEPVLTPKQSSFKGVECFDVQIPTPGSKTSEAPVSGYYAKPKDAKAKSCPALIGLHGAGVYDSSEWFASEWANKGFIAMNVNAHGIANGQPQEFYKKLDQGKFRGYPGFGKTDREESYFTGMFMRVVRALDFLKAQPEWDGRVLVAYGSSQAGAQSIVAGGLDPQVSLVCAAVPALCDHGAYEAERMVGWPRLTSWNTPKERNDTYYTVLKASRYVDSANFATRIKGKAIFSVGFIDYTCCPSSVYAAFNNVPNPTKVMINYKEMGHAFPKENQAKFIEYVMKHVKETR